MNGVSARARKASALALRGISAYDLNGKFLGLLQHIFAFTVGVPPELLRCAAGRDRTELARAVVQVFLLSPCSGPLVWY